MEEALQALRRPPGLEAARATELVLISLALLGSGSRAAAMPVLRRALAAFRSEPLSDDEELRAITFACVVALNLWDDDGWYVLSARHVQLARDAGALTVLPVALELHAASLIASGQFAAAKGMLDESDAVSEAIESAPLADAAVVLASWLGDESAAFERIERAIADASARGENSTITSAETAAATLLNALGRYPAAIAAAQRACDHHPARSFPKALVEMAEAAVRSGAPDLAADALERLSPTTTAAGTDWALGIELRTRALVSEDAGTDGLYREAIDRLARTRLAPELARAHLLYGEWLRRGRRRVDARPHLRAAHEAFVAVGARAFADRAARELLATGETARKRGLETPTELTAQEAQVARLAREGLSNPEIGARLFISPRTVQYHLHKVFAKLEISSRAELELALAVGERERVS
jgi:DNA-binding CsgD family transcriptional regulator/tetratricopeptide (TPR) repeat protein